MGLVVSSLPNWLYIKKRTMVPEYNNDELNYLKLTLLVQKEFSKALRQAFKFLWDDKFGPANLWDDSPAVRNLFLTKEGSSSNKLPIGLSYEKWDCTALFQATIYAKTFAVHHSTLSDLYVKPLGVPSGSFLPFVVSPSGNKDETFALAIDQLRRLRNSHCHPDTSAMDRTKFDQYMQLTKDAFKALGVKTDKIDATGSMPESHFPTAEVTTLERKNRHLRFVVLLN